MTPEHAFTVDVPEELPPGQTLLIGLPHVGMASLTTVDHVVRTLPSEMIGGIAPAELPAITPFEDGIPRNHTRLYDLIDSDLVVLVGELFVPTVAASAFADMLAEWMTSQGIDEVAFLHGVPYPHGPEEHAVFYVATESYRSRHLTDAEIKPMKGGYLDGVAGEVVTRSMSDTAPPAGVFLTPTHPPGPDVEAAIRFLDAIESVYDLVVDRHALEELSAEIEAHYANLAERMAALEEQHQASMSTDFRDDRMFM